MANRLLVALMVFAAMAVVSVSGDGSQSTDPVPVSVFGIDVSVQPASGPIPIPPANPTSMPYELVVVIRDSGDRLRWGLPRTLLYAGERKNRQSEFGDYQVACSVEIDERGESATVVVNLFRGRQPVLSQRFLAWLPPSQLDVGPRR